VTLEVTMNTNRPNFDLAARIKSGKASQEDIKLARRLVSPSRSKQVRAHSALTEALAAHDGRIVKRTRSVSKATQPKAPRSVSKATTASRTAAAAAPDGKRVKASIEAGRIAKANPDLAVEEIVERALDAVV
jgi:hypothetical protein